MRRLTFLVAVMCVSGALAQNRPPNLEPLPEPLPPPPIPGPDDRAVRIPVQEGDKVEEIRDGGRIVAIKVTPPGGKPYYLQDITGVGNFIRRDSLDGIQVPLFPINTFD